MLRGLSLPGKSWLPEELVSKDGLRILLGGLSAPPCRPSFRHGIYRTGGLKPPTPQFWEVRSLPGSAWAHVTGRPGKAALLDDPIPFSHSQDLQARLRGGEGNGN